MEQIAEIVKLFCKDIFREITIRQISKSIKKSYAYTNKEVWGLVEKGVLKEKKIGNSVVCSINISSESARALLSFNSFLEKEEYFKKNEDVKSKIAHLINESKEKGVFTAFLVKNELVLVCFDKSVFKGSELKAKIITQDEFSSFIKNSGFDNLVVYGYEKYWESIGDIYG